MCVQLFRIGLRTLFRELNRMLDLTLHSLLDLSKFLVVKNTLFCQALSEKLNRVSFLVLLNFGAGAIVSGVGHRMTHETISPNFQKRWEVVLSSALDRSGHCFSDRQNVHSIDEF